MKNLYYWQALNKQGVPVNGEIMADTLTLAKISLLQQGMYAVKIRPKRQIFGLIRRNKKINKKQICNFTNQLKNLLNAGIAILPAINIIHDNEANPIWRAILERVKAKIAAGQPLSVVLAEYPEYFDDLYCNLIYAGEQASQLPVILDSISEYQEKMQSLKQKINKAIFYPSVVVIIAMLITLFLCLFVVPQFESVFASFGAQLPLITRLVVGIANGLRHYGWIMLVIASIFYFAIHYAYKKSPDMRLYLAHYPLQIPFVGIVLATAITARCLYTIAVALQAGVALPSALSIAAEVAGKPKYRQGILQIKQAVIAGERLHKAMQSTTFFTLEMVQMIAVSEETGGLAVMLHKIAKTANAQVDGYLEMLTKLLEPAIMFILSIIVGGLILAMYLPIFQLGGVV